MKSTLRIVFVSALVLIMSGLLLIGVSYSKGGRWDRESLIVEEKFSEFEEKFSDLEDKFFKSRSKVNVGTFRKSDSKIDSLNFELNYGNISIVYGDEFDIISNSDEFKEIKNYVEDGVWHIDEEDKSFLDNNYIHNLKYTITVPEGFVPEETNIVLGAGNLNIEELSCKEVYLEVGAGNLTVKNLLTESLDLDCGVGNANISGTIGEEGDIQCGLGNVDLDLTGSADDYSYSIDAGIGKVTIDGEKYSGIISASRSNDGASKTLDIDCGVGSVKVNFKGGK